MRDSKNIGFIELSDGGCFKPLQIVFEAAKLDNYREIAKAGVGTSLQVTGRVVLTPGAKQPFEVNADEIRVLGVCGPEYPLQKKRHTVEFLRTMPHLRPRTNTFAAAFRVRSVAAYAIHKFFQENGFVYAHTPVSYTHLDVYKRQPLHLPILRPPARRQTPLRSRRHKCIQAVPSGTAFFVPFLYRRAHFNKYYKQRIEGGIER